MVARRARLLVPPCGRRPADHAAGACYATACAQRLAKLTRRTRATRRPLPERLHLWRARPLPPDLLRYVADDVRWLPDLARRLGALADRGQGLELDGDTGALVAELSQRQVRRNNPRVRRVGF
jgi:hypothetical protein